jgi:predicted RNA-binding protein with PUA-like domain
MAKRYWLMKSEPDVYSIDDLERDGSTCWEGVRNYGARNNMRDMKVGDEVLFYHSNAKPPGIAGLARVVKEAYPDHFAFDKANPYFDPKSDPDNPRWFMVDVEFKEAFPAVLPLGVLRDTAELGEMALFKRPRLSVQPVTPEEFRLIRKMGRRLKASPPA